MGVSESLLLLVTIILYEKWLFQKLDAHPVKKTWESQKFCPHFSWEFPQN